METDDFDASLQYCESEAELRGHHAIQLFDALCLLADRASRGEIDSAELIEAIRSARYASNNTRRADLAAQEAEVTAHGEPSLKWLGR